MVSDHVLGSLNREADASLAVLESVPDSVLPDSVKFWRDPQRAVHLIEWICNNCNTIINNTVQRLAAD